MIDTERFFVSLSQHVSRRCRRQSKAVFHLIHYKNEQEAEHEEK